jgi:hypothetical protein
VELHPGISRDHGPFWVPKRNSHNCFICCESGKQTRALFIADSGIQPQSGKTGCWLSRPRSIGISM